MMNCKFLALAPLLLLCACATVCAPAPANPMPDSPFRNYRLSSLVIETTDLPSQPFSKEIQDTRYIQLYRPHYYPQASEIIHAAFSKPSDKRYADAPAVHMLCTMEAVTPSAMGFLDNQSARFVGKISIVDPVTKRTVASKECDFDAETVPNAAKEKCGQRGLPGLSDVIHQCLRQFAPEMKSSVLKPQPTPGVLLDGTFIGVTADFTPNPPSLLQQSITAAYKKQDDILLDRLVTYELPTKLSKAFVDNNPFSNSAANTYGVAIAVNDSDLSSGVFTSTKVRYTAVTTILKNGKPMGSFTFHAPESILRERSAIYASHMRAILDYLRDHAAEIDKK